MNTRAARRTRSCPEEYLILSLPEHPHLFIARRAARRREQGSFLDPKTPVYDAVLYVVSPFYDLLTREPGESCSCLHWRTKRTRCIHLQRFFELNPHLDPLNQTPGPPRTPEPRTSEHDNQTQLSQPQLPQNTAAPQ